LSQQLLLEGITAQQIFDDNIADLKLSWISGLEGADRTFDTQAVKAAAASSDLVGHLNMIKSLGSRRWSTTLTFQAMSDKRKLAH